MDFTSLSRLMEEGPEPFADEIVPADAHRWHRVIVSASHHGLGLSAAAGDGEARIRTEAVLHALGSGLTRRRRSWVILHGPDAAGLLPGLEGVEVLGSARDLPLTPLFAYRRVRPGLALHAGDEDFEAQLDHSVMPVDLVEDALPGQFGFLAGTDFDGWRAVPLELRYARVARSLMGRLSIRRARWSDVADPGPDGSVLVPRLEFEGEAASRALRMSGACIVDERLRVPNDPGGGGEEPASWLVAAPGDEPSWLIAPHDLEAIGSTLLTALLLHLR